MFTRILTIAVTAIALTAFSHTAQAAGGDGASTTAGDMGDEGSSALKSGGVNRLMPHDDQSDGAATVPGKQDIPFMLYGEDETAADASTATTAASEDLTAAFDPDELPPPPEPGKPIQTGPTEE